MTEIKKIPITSIVVTGNNPRQTFPEEGLRNLGESMLTHGQIDPIIVRPKGNFYELVAGERRWRAAQLVGITELDAKIQDLDDASCAEIRLVENTQREDLTYAEKGDDVLTLMEKYPDKYPTLVSVAKALNVSVGLIRNYWIPSAKRLSPNLRNLTASGEFGERLAIYLLKYDHKTQDKLVKVIIDNHVSGHENADIVKFLISYDATPTANLEELAQEAKGTKFVRIDTSELTPTARKEVDAILTERKKEVQKIYQDARNKGNQASRSCHRSRSKNNTLKPKTLESCSPPVEQTPLRPSVPTMLEEEKIKSIAVALSYQIPTFERLLKFMGTTKMILGDAIAYLTEKGLEVEGV